MPSLWALPLALLPLTLGCSPDEISAEDDDAADGGDTGGGSEDGSNFEPVPVRGDLALTTVLVNQGVDVPIAVNGEWIGPADRNTYVVANRDTLVRGFWELPEGWVEREITARLELEYDDGTSEVLEDTKLIDRASFPGGYDRSFVFPLVAEDLPPGVKFHMSLWEAEPGYEDLPESTVVTEAPLGGLQQIGVQPEPAEIKVVFVPVAYTGGGCNTDTSTLTEEEEQKFIDYLHEQNPVKEVVWDFRRDTPIEWGTELTGLWELWEPLQQMRVADAAGPNVYYYALVNACANGIDGAGGIAPGTPPPTKDSAMLRVSTGLWLPNQKDYSYHTFVHELGHNQGLAHVFCAGGDAAGTDPGYPYDNGVIGVWGFGIRRFQFQSPTATFDYMTYCSPNWVSDWTWNKTYNQIRTLTSWDSEGGAPSQPEGELLMGVIGEDGVEKWWTVPGSLPTEHYSGEQWLSFDYGGEELELPAAVQTLDDGSAMIVAPVPKPGITAQAVTRVDHLGSVHAVEL